jgi:putative peptidoglycan lipid II flippase
MLRLHFAQHLHDHCPDLCGDSETETATQAIAVHFSSGAMFVLIDVGLAIGLGSISLTLPRLTPDVKPMLALDCNSAAHRTRCDPISPVGGRRRLRPGPFPKDQPAIITLTGAKPPPLGLPGIAIGTAILPALSQTAGAGQGRVGYATAPWRCAFFSQCPQLRVLIVPGSAHCPRYFEHGAFFTPVGYIAGRRRFLLAFSAGVPAYVLIKVLTPGFFTRAATPNVTLAQSYGPCWSTNLISTSRWRISALALRQHSRLGQCCIIVFQQARHRSG